MQTIIKIPRKLLAAALLDLHRPHPFACERAGFFSTKISQSATITLVHCIAYHPVQEQHYVRDTSVGVRIGPGAITVAMSRILKDGVGQLHVHSHGGSDLPGPSGTDYRELPPLSCSLRNVDSSKAHGWLILSHDDAWSSLTIGERSLTAPAVSIVGLPTAIRRRQHGIQPRTLISRIRARLEAMLSRGEDRYDRQSFLGPDSPDQIRNAVVGILGLGGGGSHIVQQLAHLGFRRFVICDPDVIATTNLNRLVGGSVVDVLLRRKKIKIAVRAIRRLQPNAEIVVCGTKWEDGTDALLTCDVVMGSVDSFCARRDIEAFCRRHLIPYIDVGMDVQKAANGKHELYGQVITSIPGEPCMHCMGFLNERVLGVEAQRYGSAGGKPQVVWSNGLLASAAVGILVDMITDWSGTLRAPRYLTLKGGQLLLTEDRRLGLLEKHSCPHYPLRNAGDAVFSPL